MCTKTCIYLLLLLGLALPALSDKCPDPNRFPTTCSCEEDNVDEEVDVAILCSSATMNELKDALRLMDSNTKLEVRLEEMDLQSLPSRIFDGWYVVRLDISDCQLDSLAPPGQVALAGLEDKLEVLEITSSFSEDNQPTKIDLGHLRILREVDLAYNIITELSNDWFARGPASLAALSVSNNGIQKIGDRAFATLVNLEQLSIDGNRFGPIKRSMLPRPANQLEDLELDNNAFTSVPDDLFTDMPELKELSIQTNGIAHLQERAFKPIWSQLDVFDARGNPLECDSTMEWMFNARTKATVLGTCEGPLGKRGLELEDFIRKRGQ
ncbi:hypothetical protein AVEN_275434-1 [Araneus ventricosus]|uniref:Uncharacterized protein n=1 Tax=Araneus ventricosus TaxID=182803 RepID=A0A4Y2LDQ2_ARAVE|nr:hypothetical protein AVEN_275434-1 [Araneus ventricosus]